MAEALPDNVSLQELVETDLSASGRDELSYVAGLATQAGLSPHEVGTLVHRVAELRTLHRHPDEVLDGLRYVEQPIDLTEETSDDGKSGEIDEIIVRGDHYSIRDHKPINLAKFEETPGGEAWAAYMRENVGENYREQISQGRNPFVDDMPTEIRAPLRDYLSKVNAEHAAQLSSYRDAFIASNPTIDPGKVNCHVRPYFVYR